MDRAYCVWLEDDTRNSCQVVVLGQWKRPSQHDKIGNILILGLNVPEGLPDLEEADIHKFVTLTLLSSLRKIVYGWKMTLEIAVR